MPETDPPAPWEYSLNIPNDPAPSRSAVAPSA